MKMSETETKLSLVLGISPYQINASIYKESEKELEADNISQDTPFRTIINGGVLGVHHQDLKSAKEALLAYITKWMTEQRRMADTILDELYDYSKEERKRTMKVPQEEIVNGLFFAIEQALDHWEYENTFSAEFRATSNEESCNTGVVTVSNGQKFRVTVEEITE